MTEDKQSPATPQRNVPAHLLSAESTLPTNIQHLLRMVAGHPDPALPCGECEPLLPAYVTAEVDGLAVTALYPEVKRHLDLCNECIENYLDMLDLALAEVRGEYTSSAAPPPPDLSFLPPLKMTLGDYVGSLAKRLIAHLAPSQQRRFDDLAPVFFSQVTLSKAHFSLDAGFKPAVRLGAGEELGALEILTATYLATESLTGTLASQRGETSMDAETVAAVATEKATAAATVLQLNPQQAQSFTQQFVEQVRQDHTMLQAVARHAE